jgi:hypothetical protein
LLCFHLKKGRASIFVTFIKTESHSLDV